jgi:hypothetical protein
MGPLYFPWLTFCAWMIAIGCIAFSKLWAIFLYKPGDDDHE